MTGAGRSLPELDDVIGEALRDADLVFFAMNHDAFRALDPPALRRLARPDALVCDVWNLHGTGRIHFLLSEP